MKIRKILVHRIAIPFKKPFRHATHVRTQTDNVIVETILEDGNHGYGEGLPREYVTGETVDSVLTTLRNLDPELFKTDFQKLDGLVAYLDEVVLSRTYFKEDRQNNTARCALELSLLDAFCRSFNKRFRDVALLVWPALAETREQSFVYYDGVLSLETTKKVLWNAVKMRLYGFRRLKLKVDADDTETLKLARLVRNVVGAKRDLRLDSNEAWTPEQTVDMAHRLAPLGISCLEQPLPHRDVMQMREVTAASPIPTMLDESLCTLEDAEMAIENKLCKLFNIRLSKCGGFLNSLRIAQLAERYGMGYQLGCLVGETALLSAAGRQMATLLPSLRYLEGSYDRHLLRGNVSTQDITFAYGGKAPALDGKGLGLMVDSLEQNQYTTTTFPLYEIT